MTESQLATYRAALIEARASFDRAKTRLRELTEESFELEDEIGRLRRTITALAAMCSEEPYLDNLGITDSCMEVMEEERATVSTADVVKALEARGFDMASQKNAQASVHAVLSRLAKKGKIERVSEASVGTSAVVFWRGPNFDPKWD